MIYDLTIYDFFDDKLRRIEAQQQKVRKSFSIFLYIKLIKLNNCI